MEESKRPPCCSRAILMDWFSANRSIPFTILLYGIAGTSLLAISMKLSLRKLLLLWSPLDWLILGYIHVNIDDCWSNLLRDSKGQLVPHPETFPQGIKLLADYVHSKGLKLGIYSDAG
ncbi:BnaA05g18270D [Brassica napus]|uniref:Alpha-galactosidase n=1 Tax=Brassica napus TaxID=3708 RepID=A0A078GUV1_BRANA|nr:BnaA05g18270D [Brassica napus]